MVKQYDIHKAGGIIIKNRKLLVEKSVDKDHFIAPGGTIEKGELVVPALIRELYEEFQIRVSEHDLSEFGTFYAIAAGNKLMTVRMDVFLVNKWLGEIVPDNEVEKILWITSKLPEGVKVGSIFEHEVIPRLKVQDLID